MQPSNPNIRGTSQPSTSSSSSSRIRTESNTTRTTRTTTTRSNHTPLIARASCLFFLIVIVQIIFIIVSHDMIHSHYDDYKFMHFNIDLQDGSGGSSISSIISSIQRHDDEDDGLKEEKSIQQWKEEKKNRVNSAKKEGVSSSSTQKHITTKTTTTNPPNFTRYDKVAIVTKVHWSNDLSILKRMLCLFNAAYNQYVNYDIIVFTTIPWPTYKIQALQAVVPNSNLQVVIDGPSPTGNIQDYIVNMTLEELSSLKQRCGGDGDKSQTLDWFNHCTEEGMNIVSNLAYNWQSEFRSYHIYIHPALRPYKYMLWMDSDALCTQPWTIDPMKYMVEENLTVMFPNFPAGKTEHPKLRTKIETIYGQSICHAILNKEGYLWGKECNPDKRNELPHFQHIHGFHHITNLDVYRKPIHLKFLHSATVGEYKFSRLWDDQLCVTVPAVMDDAKGKAWDYRKHNITTNIFHHGEFDGKGKGTFKKYRKWWRLEGAEKWDIGREMCDNYVMFVKD